MEINNNLPYDFDWKCYLSLNEDIANNKRFNSEEGAIEHWNKYGSKEGRKYKLENHGDKNKTIITNNISTLKNSNKKTPLVLVVIPTYNSKNTILDSINSVLNQTYKNINLVVVDDCSTDNTEEVIKDIKNIFYYKLDKNVGTYSAVNYGISKHKNFDYFIIHGSDDIMLETNIEEHINGFSDGIYAVSTGYSRIDYQTKETISVKTTGDSMIMYSKDVFDTLGYYDNTRFGGDSEYFTRFRKCFGNNATKNIKKSLSNCYIFKNKSNLTLKIPINSPERANYVTSYKLKHNNMQLNNDFYIYYSGDLIDKKISVNLATYPKRTEYTTKVLNSLLNIHFIDTIRVYLNEYKNVPKEFPKDSRIIYHIGEKNLKDSGKFYWSGTFKNEYYFSIDDDLIYSEEYFINHISMLKRYNNEIFVTTHGKVMREKPKKFNDSVLNFRCLETTNKNQWVNNPGTGVCVFDNSKYIVPVSMFEYHGMADLWLGVYCQKLKIPILCRKHIITELKYLNVEDTLFDRRDELKDDHDKVLSLLDSWTLYKKDNY